MNYTEALALTGARWNTLEESEKIEVLQSIENHMAFESHRIACPVDGKFLYTGTDGIVIGTYDPDSRCIYINSTQFEPSAKYGKDADTLINTCIHEGRHAFQHQAVDGIAFHSNREEVEAWRSNLQSGNYISFRENPRAYYNQPVEVDARSFAELKTKELISEREQLELKETQTLSHAKNAFCSHMNEGNTITDTAAKFEVSAGVRQEESDGIRF